MAHSNRETVDAITEAVLTASRLLVSVSARSIASVDDAITIAQFRVLVVLETRGAMNLASLAAHLRVQPSTMTRMAERLVQSNLITRTPNPASRRESTVELTAHGRSVVTEVTARRRDEIGRIISEMRATDRTGLVRALTAFTAAGGEPAVTELASEASWA